jgi:nicotinamidase-related amidase
MGINADFCVLDTARTAIRLGYQVITSNDVIAGGRRNDSANNSIDKFERIGTCVNISQLESIKIFPKSETAPA